MQNNELRNNLIKMFNANKDYSNNEIDRLGSFSQKSTTYRRNGMLNFGARQMMAITDISYATFGGSHGGSTIAGS